MAIAPSKRRQNRAAETAGACGDRDWLSPKGAASSVLAGPRSIYRAIASGELRAVMVNGRDIRIHRDWLAEWMSKRPQP